MLFSDPFPLITFCKPFPTLPLSSLRQTIRKDSADWVAFQSVSWSNGHCIIAQRIVILYLMWMLNCAYVRMKNSVGCVLQPRSRILLKCSVFTIMCKRCVLTATKVEFIRRLAWLRWLSFFCKSEFLLLLKQFALKPYFSGHTYVVK